MRRRKITVQFQDRAFPGMTRRATATYSHAGIRIQRTRSGNTPSEAHRNAKVALLNLLEQRGIDPELVNAERMLMID